MSDHAKATLIQNGRVITATDAAKPFSISQGQAEAHRTQYLGKTPAGLASFHAHVW